MLVERLCDLFDRSSFLILLDQRFRVFLIPEFFIIVKQSFQICDALVEERKNERTEAPDLEIGVSFA